MTFTFKLQFHCAVLSLQMANRPFSLHLELALRIFLAWKFNEGEKEGEFDFCQPLSFLSSWNSSPLTPFPSNLVHVHQLPVSMGLEFGLSLRCNFLVIIQKEQNNRERGREKERDFVSTIIWENKYLMITHCLFQIVLELVYSSEMPIDKWGIIKMNVEFCIFTNRPVYVPAVKASTSRLLITMSFVPANCPFIRVLQNELLIDGVGLVEKAWILEWGMCKGLSNTLTRDPHFTDENTELEWFVFRIVFSNWRTLRRADWVLPVHFQMSRNEVIFSESLIEWMVEHE